MVVEVLVRQRIAMHFYVSCTIARQANQDIRIRAVKDPPQHTVVKIALSQRPCHVDDTVQGLKAQTSSGGLETCAALDTIPRRSNVIQRQQGKLDKPRVAAVVLLCHLDKLRDPVLGGRVYQFKYSFLVYWIVLNSF